MRKNIKDTWLATHKGNDKRLYRKYRTFYRKICNINKLFYYHRIANIPMHQETKDLILAKVESYCIEMDKLYHVMITGEMPGEKIRDYHRIDRYISLGTWETYAYIGSFYISNLRQLPKLRSDYEYRKKTYEKIKEGKTDNSIFNKVKSFFNK